MSVTTRKKNISDEEIHRILFEEHDSDDLCDDFDLVNNLDDIHEENNTISGDDEFGREMIVDETVNNGMCTNKTVIDSLNN